MAHDNVRVRLAAGAVSGAGTAGARTIPAAPPAALPVITYADGLKLHLNGEEIRVIHMPAAHTDGDSIIHWTKSNVIHMGDLFMLQISFPFVDVGSGGDVRGFVAAADKVLAIANDQTKIIPGHGAIATKADLQNHRNMIATVIAKVEAGIKAGQTLDQIKASQSDRWLWCESEGFISADRFVETVYNNSSDDDCFDFGAQRCDQRLDPLQAWLLLIEDRVKREAFVAKAFIFAHFVAERKR